MDPLTAPPHATFMSERFKALVSKAQAAEQAGGPPKSFTHWANAYNRAIHDLQFITSGSSRKLTGPEQELMVWLRFCKMTKKQRQAQIDPHIHQASAVE